MFDVMRLFIPAEWHAVSERGELVMRRRHNGVTERRQPTEEEAREALWTQAIR